MHSFSPVFNGKSLYAIEMLGIMCYNDEIFHASCNSYQQIKVFNSLSDALQTHLLTTESIGNFVDTYYIIIIYQQLCLCQFLLPILIGCIVGSIQQFDGGNSRNAAQLILLYALLPYTFVTTQ